MPPKRKQAKPAASGTQKKSKPSTPSIKLCYFDLRGRAEVSRLILALAGEKYEDVRWAREDWPKYKPDAPFGQAPYLEYNGEKFAQSIAIANFLARKFGFYADDLLDQFRIDEMVQLVSDMWQALYRSYYLQDEAKKAECDKKVDDEDLPRYMGFLQKRLKESGTGVFVGEKLTVADLAVYDVLFQIKNFRTFKDFDKFPEVQALMTKVEETPNLKKYLKTRKHTPM